MGQLIHCIEFSSSKPRAPQNNTIKLCDLEEQNNTVISPNSAYEISKIECFFAILPQEPHWGSLEKANQPPGPDHTCSVQTEKSLAILKIFICSIGKLLEKHVLISYICIAKHSSFIQ